MILELSPFKTWIGFGKIKSYDQSYRNQVYKTDCWNEYIAINQTTCNSLIYMYFANTLKCTSHGQLWRILNWDSFQFLFWCRSIMSHEESSDLIDFFSKRKINVWNDRSMKAIKYKVERILYRCFVFGWSSTALSPYPSRRRQFCEKARAPPGVSPQSYRTEPRQWSGASLLWEG